MQLVYYYGLICKKVNMFCISNLTPYKKLKNPKIYLITLKILTVVLIIIIIHDYSMISYNRCFWTLSDLSLSIKNIKEHLAHSNKYKKLDSDSYLLYGPFLWMGSTDSRLKSNYEETVYNLGYQKWCLPVLISFQY